MPQNYAGRVTLIIVVLLVALFGIPALTGGIFTFRPFSSDERDKELLTINLKPGIDIAGGTSLLYEIKPPSGGSVNTGKGTLAEQVAALLKKRVDPTGVRNLIWRPTGDTRLEIQIPRATLNRGQNSNQVQKDYQKIKDEIESANISSSAVVNAVEKQSGAERDKALATLAHDLPSRRDLFKRLVENFDKLKSIDAERAELRKAAKPDEAKLEELVKRRVEVQKQYDQDKAKIEQTNLSLDNLQALAEAAGPPAPGPNGEKVEADRAAQDAAAKEIADLAARLPERKALIEQFAALYPKYLASRNSIDDAAELKRRLKGSGVLEFHIMVDNPRIEQPEMLRRLEPGGDGPAAQAGDQSRWFEVDKPSEFGGDVRRWRDKFYALAWTTPERSMIHGDSGRDWGLERASFTHDQQTSKPLVTFSFDDVGGALFSRLTSVNIKKRLATILDNRIITAPNINSQIGKHGQIDLGSGNGETEGPDIAAKLSAGSLPAQLADEPISERQVGPQLGESNLRAGLQACAVGLVVVAIFMVFYYHVAGFVAFIAVLMNLTIILGVMGMMGATFTLPGIAALVLTIGMSVDANVLIFERLREEQMRGLTLKLALRNAYERAFTAILDSNVTTAITSAFLIYFGSEEVKGFGLTLLIGIIASMFSALFVTKTIFGLMIERYGLRKLGSLPLTFPRWNQIMHPKVDWMNKVPYFLAFSGVVIVVGWIAFIQQAKAGKLLDVEFTSGTDVQITTKEAITDNEVRDRIATVADRIPQPTIVAIGDEVGNTGKYHNFSIVTANDKRKEVTDAIGESMGNLLDVAVPSKFAGSDTTVADAIKAESIRPITLTKNRFLVGDVEVADAASLEGGVAIVLDNVIPPLTPKELADRVYSSVVRGGDNTALSAPRVSRLDNNPSASDPVRRAVVMFAPKTFKYSTSPADWREKLAGPAWVAVVDGITSPPKLEKVSNFDAQIAGDTQKSAMAATIGSIVAIMVWIWLRFGDHKYGTATVAAMIHDTVMVIGFIGLSHWLAGSAAGNILGMEAFRVNMTLVAAILTVMSYSMVDTIVVFDRIRENRGKYGTLSRTLINDSINQTLSRTLLTAGSTLITLFVMYVWGGPAIHGFTFVLLVGIVIGTYSSIAIGAPILLIGVKSPTAGQSTPTSKSTNAGAVTPGVARV